MLKLLPALCAFVILVVLSSPPADAQRYVQPRYVPPPMYNERNQAIGQGIEELFNYGQQYQQQQEWAEQQRRMWEADQAAKQRWMQEQENRRYMQEQQRYVQPHPNSSPMIYAPAQNYQQRGQGWQQQHQGRQQMLDQWGQPRLPQW